MKALMIVICCLIVTGCATTPNMVVVNLRSCKSKSINSKGIPLGECEIAK